MKGIKVIKSDGTEIDLGGKKLDWRELGKLTDSGTGHTTFEHVPIHGQGRYQVGKQGMMVNESGLLYNLPINPKACKLSAFTTFNMMFVENPIVGDVVIIEHEEEDFQ